MSHNIVKARQAPQQNQQPTSSDNNMALHWNGSGVVVGSLQDNRGTKPILSALQLSNSSQSTTPQAVTFTVAADNAVPASSTLGGAINRHQQLEPQQAANTAISRTIQIVSDQDANHTNSNNSNPNENASLDWIKIHSSFQTIINCSSEINLFLLSGICTCFIPLTLFYKFYIDDYSYCDVPLGSHYQLVAAVMILTIFRCCMEILGRFCWKSSNSKKGIASRVMVAFNVMFRVFQLLVLGIGIVIVMLGIKRLCPHISPELYFCSVAFVSMSTAAWLISIFGVIIPSYYRDRWLKVNGFTSDQYIPLWRTLLESGSGFFGALLYAPSIPPYSTENKPRRIELESFPDSYPRQCCICKGNFLRADVIVANSCDHVFHKPCCQEWLLGDRCCPICRAVIDVEELPMRRRY